jgi:hypothetical protein
VDEGLKPALSSLVRAPHAARGDDHTADPAQHFPPGDFFGSGTWFVTHSDLVQ